MSPFKSIGRLEATLLALGIIYALLSANPLLTLSAIFIPFIFMKLLWKNSESPFLFFALLMQSLAVTVKVFYANYLNIDFKEVHESSFYIVDAYYNGLIGLIAIALGIHLIIRKINLNNKSAIFENSLTYNSRKLLKVYLIAVIVYPILFKLSFSLGGLQQPLSKLIEFKWSIMLLFMFNSLYTGKYRLFIMIVVIEIILSFTSFFASFKDYFLILFIGLMIIYGKSFKISYFFPLSIILASGLYFLIIWQHVKPEYRLFLTQGARTQISTQSATESLLKLYELIKDSGQEGFEDGFERTVDRLSYIDFLSASESQVPVKVPHTNGVLWWGAIEHVLKPRIFFPDKLVIDDSEKTRLYTGRNYAGASQGTSISLGYFAESYVDFGLFGMHVVLFAFGLLIGYIYKYVMEHSPDVLIGTALIIPLFFVIYNYEKALDKIFGALIMYFLAYLMVNRFLLKSFLNYLKR